MHFEITKLIYSKGRHKIQDAQTRKNNGIRIIKVAGRGNCKIGGKIRK